MTVYVDDMRRHAQVGGRFGHWSHLFADTPEELAEFAMDLGLHSGWLQKAGTYREHYDVTESYRVRALNAGAQGISYPHDTANLLLRKRQEADL